MNGRENLCIAYFAIHSTRDDAGHIGGMLVIDKNGIPTEFRCTLPVRPTPAQKALYGSTLEPYVFNQLIGLPLSQSVQTQPECYIAERTALLGLREHTEIPVIYLERYGESLSASGSVDSENQQRLDSPIGAFQPVTAKCHHSYQSDYGAVRENLEHTFNRIDLLEPFERIANAIKALSERDDRFR